MGEIKVWTHITEAWPIILWLIIISFHAGIISWMVRTLWKERERRDKTWLTIDKHTDICKINRLELVDGVIENVREMIKAMKSDILEAINKKRKLEEKGE